MFKGVGFNNWVHNSNLAALITQVNQCRLETHIGKTTSLFSIPSHFTFRCDYCVRENICL